MNPTFCNVQREFASVSAAKSGLLTASTMLAEPCVELLNKVLQAMLADLTALKEAGVDAPEALTLMAKLAIELCAPSLPFLQLHTRMRALRSQLAMFILDANLCVRTVYHTQTFYACEARALHEADRDPGMQLERTATPSGSRPLHSVAHARAEHVLALACR